MKRKNVFNDYEIQENGDVISLKLGKRRKLKPAPDGFGHLYVCICNDGKVKNMKLHRLVALQYLPPQPSPKHEIRHIDGNKINNHFSNLCWGTHAENQADMVRHGTSPRGERHGLSRITEDQARRIKFLKGKVERGYYSKLARALRVNHKIISDILCDKTWRWIK